MKLATGMLTPIELALNAYLKLTPEAVRRLEPLAGNAVAISVTGLDLSFYLLFEAEYVRLKGEYEGISACRIQGSLPALLKLATMEGNDFSASGAQFYGDMDIGRSLRAFIRALDIDWEEQASHIFGDVIAHQMGNVVRSTQEFGQKTFFTLRRNLAEFLQFETGDLPTRTEMDEFLTSVDVLRADIDRMALRIKRLQVALDTKPASDAVVNSATVVSLPPQRST